MDRQMLGRVVIAEPFDERGIAVLTGAGVEVVSCVGSSADALQRALGEARGLIVRSQTRVDDALLAQGPQLAVVARAGVGIDGIDIQAATAAGIVVVNTPSANTISAAEHTFALMLAAMRHVPEANASLRAQKWERKAFVGRELYGKTLGLVGLGRIACNVASRAIAFGMRVIASDPYVPASRAGALGVELVEFEDLLAAADIVSLHVALTPLTERLIDARALERMRAGAVLVNTARGALVDAPALLDALDAGRIFAAIDVVAEEPPPPDSPSARLLSHARVVATPHLGGSTQEAQARIALELADDVVRVLQGRPASGAVNAPTLSGAAAESAGGFVDLAFRLGAALPQLFDDALRQEIAVVMQGDLAEIDAGPFVAALLAGALPFVSDRRITIVNAVSVAGEIGIRTMVTREAAAKAFRSSLSIAAGTHRLVGTVLHDGPRIVDIDGLEVDAIADGTMLLTRHRDVPGMVGKIGTLLGNAAINISTMQVARDAQGRGAMMVLDVDRAVPREALDAIANVDGIDSVRLIQL